MEVTQQPSIFEMAWPTQDNHLLLSIVMTTLVLLCGNWMSLACTFIAMILSCSVSIAGGGGGGGGGARGQGGRGQGGGLIKDILYNQTLHLLKRDCNLMDPLKVLMKPTNQKSLLKLHYINENAISQNSLQNNQRYY